MDTAQITVTGSPHAVCRLNTRAVMLNVVLALIPALATGIWIFGWRAAAVTIITIAGCMSTEYLCSRYMLGRGNTLKDCSALLTGMLLGMSLPSSLPFAMGFFGGVFAIGIGKMAFGGLGQNIFNPAMVGRVFLLISFPAEMTSWPLPHSIDGATGPTLLTSMAESGVDARSVDLFQIALGNMGGSLGEIGAIALLAGGAYLLIRGIIRIWIPLSIFLVVSLLSLITGHDVAMELLSGGLIIGALFMATDYVTSPMTKGGMIIYGALIGLITFIIRHYGSYPEGISFAILIMNGFTPLINRWMKPRVFGERRRK